MPVFLGIGLRSFESSSFERVRLEKISVPGSRRTNKPQIPREAVVEYRMEYWFSAILAGL